MGHQMGAFFIKTLSSQSIISIGQIFFAICSDLWRPKVDTYLGIAPRVLALGGPGFNWRKPTTWGTFPFNLQSARASRKFFIAMCPLCGYLLTPCEFWARSSAPRGQIREIYTILEMGDQAWAFIMNTYLSQTIISIGQKFFLQVSIFFKKSYFQCIWACPILDLEKFHNPNFFLLLLGLRSEVGDGKIGKIGVL